MGKKELFLGGLESWVFDNQFIQTLPADPEAENYRRQVFGACFSYVSPALVTAPTLVAYSNGIANQLGLSEKECKSEQFAQVFAGNQLLPDMVPYAMCYGGHQFGNWAGQLGDGRAINLGEIVNQKNQRWAIQLKGAGPTPYSRSADGLAVLRSSIREFLCSEAMFYLGVPTTRALSVILTGEQVVRDMFYSGNPQAEQGAVVCRVAPSFTRFGSFQIFTSRGEIDLLRQFVEYTIRTDFPHLIDQSMAHKENLDKDIYLKWFEEVCRVTAEMILHWQRVGFVHGVMNTDNMSILGLTIDYGPYGWLDDYNPDWTPNTTDAGERRYRYSQQPQIALWNLVQLANAIYPLIEEEKPLQQALAAYSKTYDQGWQSMMASKLGFNAYIPQTDDALCKELLVLLAEVEVDMTIFYRKLALLDVSINLASLNDEQLLELLLTPLLSAWYRFEAISDSYKSRFVGWLCQYLRRLQDEKSVQNEKQKRMNGVNPRLSKSHTLMHINYLNSIIYDF